MGDGRAKRTHRAAGAPAEPAQNELSRRVWEARYRHVPATDAVPERSLGETWDRVAHALASVEARRRDAWQSAFRRALDDFRFLPGGRILAGAGASSTATLANCFVSGVLEDSTDVVFERLKESALTMQWGGGIGCDFTPLPPRGASAAGPVAYLRIWDAMCDAVSAGGSRRGAMMGTLRCDHPDIEQFIDAKRAGHTLRNFNLSVLVTDAFMAALAADAKWPLRFPCAVASASGETSPAVKPGAIVRLVQARSLWNRIVDSAYAAAEPGVLFIDRINRHNNLRALEQIATTNPCGEVPLPPNGVCMLGSLNLPAFVRGAFTEGAELDVAALDAAVPTAVRMLDDAIELSLYPVEAQALEARATRRIGLGVTGLADALIMLGLRYDSEDARGFARSVVARIRDAAYRASADLAQQKGSFPRFDCDAYLASVNARSLPAAIRGRIARHGLRNSHLIAIAPAGSISLLANNVSSGIEPVFAVRAERRVVDAAGTAADCTVEDYAYALFRAEHSEALPPAFVTAEELTSEAHLEMVAALQPLVDGGISKTINVPADISRAAFAGIYERAYALGLKGCSVFRPNETTGSVLKRAAGSCCGASERR